MKHLKGSLTITYLLIILSVNVSSQVVNRAEVVEDNHYFYDNAVVPVEDKGIIYIAGSDKNENLKIEYYSTELQKLSTQSFATGPDVQYYDTEIFNGKAYSVFSSTWKFFGVLVTDLSTMKGQFISGKLPSKIYMQQFVVIGNNIYIRGLDGNDDILMQFNLQSKRAKLIPITVTNYSKKKVIPQDLQVVNEELYLFVNVDNKKGDKDLLLMIGDKEGRFKAPVDITKDLPVKVLSANTDFVDGKVMIAGTFTANEVRNPQGVFLGELHNGLIANLQTYYFQDLKSYYSLMHELQKMKFELKKEMAESLDKKVQINKSTLIHDIKKGRDGFYFKVEFYDVIRQKVSDQPPTYSYSYLTTHGMVVKFDNKGKLVWDGAMNVGILSSSPHKLLSGNESEDGGFMLSAPGGDDVYLKSFDNSGAVLAEKTINLEEDKSNDNKNIKRTRAKVTHWYGNFFVASGTQVVKNDKKNKVYFMDKISIVNPL